ASASRGGRTVKSGGDELIEHLGKLGQVAQLARAARLDLGLAEPVDPHRAEAELARRDDVVEMAGRDVNVVLAIGAGLGEEMLPVAVRGLVGAELRGDD